MTNSEKLFKRCEAAAACDEGQLTERNSLLFLPHDTR